MAKNGRFQKLPDFDEIWGKVTYSDEEYLCKIWWLGDYPSGRGNDYNLLSRYVFNSELFQGLRLAPDEELQSGARRQKVFYWDLIYCAKISDKSNF